MTTIKNMKQLKQYINNHAQEILYDKRENFVQVARNHVQSDVYDKYTPNPDDPKSYKRTGKLQNSFKTTPVTHGIEIDNTRSENGRDIAEIVEKGHYNSEGYEHVKKDAPYLLPRPFMKNAKQEIKDRKLHVTELQKGLKAKGINTTR